MRLKKPRGTSGASTGSSSGTSQYNSYRSDPTGMRNTSMRGPYDSTGFSANSGRGVQPRADARDAQMARAARVRSSRVNPTYTTVRLPVSRFTTNSTTAMTSSTWMMPPATWNANPSSQNTSSNTIKVQSIVFSSRAILPALSGYQLPCHGPQPS